MRQGATLSPGALAASHDPRRHLGRAQEETRLTIEATRTREVGPNKTGAKGSATVYRVVEPGVVDRPTG
jgi:hypothetical protein